MWEELVTELKRDEGFRGEPYQCTEDVLTVGYGTTFPITEQEALYLLEHRLENVHDQLRSKLPFELASQPDGVQRALMNMGYQLGVTGLLKFKLMLQAIKEHDYNKAYLEALNSRWARQTSTRARRVAAMLVEHDNARNNTKV